MLQITINLTQLRKGNDINIIIKHGIAQWHDLANQVGNIIVAVIASTAQNI